MASNVTPSIPGAPSFCWASRKASRSVSNLQTCTYSPQNRQAASAFALRYILRRSSCRPMGAFVISPLPHLLVGGSTDSRVPLLDGHCSVSLLLRTPPPPSPLRPLSRGHRLYDLPCSAAFAGGRRRASPVT